MTADLEQLEAALRAADVETFRSLADRLARLRHPGARELLLQALQHHDPAMRAAAACAAGHLDHLETVDPLFLLLQDPEPSVREAALAALLDLAPGLLERTLATTERGSDGWRCLRDLVRLLHGEPALDDAEAVHDWPSGSGQAVKLCIALLHHPSSPVRVRAAELLGPTQDRRAVDELLLALTHADPDTRVAAAVALGEHGKTSRIVGPLVEAFHDSDARVRTTAALALSRFDVLSGSVPPDRLRSVLEHLLRHPDIEARRRVVLMLGRSRGPESVDLLLLAARDREASVRAETIVALSRFRDPRIEPVLRVALTDAEEMVRLRAVDAMERLGTPEPIPLALKDPSPTVRVQAIKALRWTLAVASRAEPVLPELLASLRDPAEAVRLEAVELLHGYVTPPVVTALAAALPGESFPLIRQKMLGLLGRHPEEHDRILAERGLPDTVRGIFRTHLEDPAPEVRAQVVQFLGDLGDPTLLPELLARCTDEAAEVRLAVARALEKFDRPDAHAALDHFLTDPAAEVRDAAVWALRHRTMEQALDLALALLADPAAEVRLSVAVLLAVFHLRGELPLERYAEVYASTELPGRLNLLDVAEGIRDRRLVPMLLAAIHSDAPTEQARALLVLTDLKRGEPARRHPRLTTELHRLTLLDGAGLRTTVRVLEPVVTMPSGVGLPTLAEPLGFHVATPARAAPGSVLRVQLWAALPGQVPRIQALASRPLDPSDYRIQSRFGATLTPRTSLSVRLHAPGLIPLDAEDDLHWDGEAAAARLLLRVPPETRPGTYPATLSLYRDGLRIGRVTTTLVIGPEDPTVAWPLAVTTRYHRAVGVAASEDRDQAEGRLAALRRVLPDLDTRLLAEGESVSTTAEVVYLFWSRTAGPLVEWMRRFDSVGEVSVLPLDPPEPAEADWIWSYLRGRLRG